MEKSGPAGSPAIRNARVGKKRLAAHKGGAYESSEMRYAIPLYGPISITIYRNGRGA
jgi:hypothetical protein